MKSIGLLFAVIFLTFTVAACSNDGSPGPLEGSWQMKGVIPMIVKFRQGETETLGMIEKVSYKTEGNDVLVTYLDGLAKGTTMRYTMTGQDSARTELGALQRVR
jgi:hypothetical protein